jgi:hypothetical protein
MGNAKVPAADNSAARAGGNRVEISLMKNNVDQLASAQASGTMGTSTSSYDNQSSGYSHNSNNSYTAQSNAAQPPTQTQPGSSSSVPSNPTPQQQ